MRSPIINLVFSSKNMNALQITDYVDRYVLDRLKNLTGVADVVIYGERRYAMRIWIDRERLAAYDLTVQDVENALRSQNVELPAGRIESVDAGIHRALAHQPQHAEASSGASASSSPTAIRCGCARSRVSSSAPRTCGASAPITAIRRSIRRHHQAGCRESAGRVSVAAGGACPTSTVAARGHESRDRQRFRGLHRPLDQGGVPHHLEAVALVVIVIIVFLRSFRASFIPIVTIPISLIATFTLMFAMGFTINTLTLLAMVLAIGLVVDDAIVVLENIFRKIEDGMKPVRRRDPGHRAKSASPSSR